ncbi:BppU family phage baseplate upper protein [Enterococcus sp. E4-185]|uniref:BppU family phage baseplate upper protein n=1 Tax=Enterococcus sp. E4-185 TaxID=2996022 RepID=UPI002D802E2F|nr:BppU family phage baseplate upper protein [Enterococcus sp. E4-185]MEB4605535.1 BppU family phage baseplate upper protein [Enterococcus sp. E4-185]
MFKINESIIVIQAEATSPNRTDIVFWSHDRGTAKLRMKLVRKNGIPQSLPEGTTVPIRLMFKSATAEGGYGKHDYLATVEDPVNGIVSIVLEDNILGYVGTVEGSVYIDFPNDRSLDTAGRFTFSIKRSPIDDSTPELEDYYFNGFSQIIDKIEKILADGKQEIDVKIKDTNDKITKANQDVATLNTNIDKANKRIDQTNQQIGDLGKLKKMYSNSIDFGDYDYSGNPNVMTKPYIAENITGGTTGLVVTPIDDGARIEKTRVDVPRPFEVALGNLLNNTDYIISYDVLVENGYVGDLRTCNVALEGQLDGKPNYFAVFYMNSVTSTDVYQKVSVKFNSGANMEKLSGFKFRVFLSQSVQVALKIKNVKIERGSTATPYQPNLLNAPYYLSKVALGENLIKPESQQPVTNSNYLIKIYNTKPMVKGKKYTITLEGTKPATQVFRPFFTRATGDAWEVGDLQPVEGLTNVWSKTFTAADDSHPTTPQVQIYQVPSTSVGQCTIKWLKLEEGDTRTPNISQFKYFGEGLKDSNNPNDYSWDVTPEYAEKALTNTLNLTDPQTALGLKNFKDGAQIDGVDVATVKSLGSVLQSGSGLTTIQSDKQSAFDEFSYEFERIGDRVFFHARVKTNSTTAVASHVNLLEIPLGFQFPIGWTIVGVPLSVVQWTTPQGEISALVITDSTGKQVVKFATNRVGNHYISGEWRTADSYPETK